MFIDDPKAQVGEVFEAAEQRAPPEPRRRRIGHGAALIEGSRITLIVGFAAAIVSAVIGRAGRARIRRGKTDTVLMRITDYFLVIPDVPLMVVAAALFGRSLQNIILIIGVIYWTTTARRSSGRRSRASGSASTFGARALSARRTCA